MVALDILQAHNIPCACYSHMSARIGDAQDGFDSGLVSAMNELAHQKGVELKMAVKVAAKLHWG